MNKKQYRLLTVLAEKAERGPRMFRLYVKRIARPRMLALQKQIHAEIADKLKASRALEFVGVEKPVEGEIVPSVRKGWTWGKVQTKNGKGYLPHFHSIGKIPNDLAIENSLGHRLTAQS